MEENTTMSNNAGVVKIAPDVVSMIASLAATEVKGVAGMAGGFTNDIAEKFGVKSSTKGIKVQTSEDEAAIDLYLIVEYGVKIPEVALAVQQNVKKAVETMTGLKAVEVNIHIQDISFGKDAKAEENSKKTK